jgi:hypothetical protein
MDPNEFNKVENITNFFNINGINLMSLKLTSDIKCGKYEKNQHIAGLESTISPKQEFEFAMNE